MNTMKKQNKRLQIKIFKLVQATKDQALGKDFTKVKTMHPMIGGIENA